MLFMGNLFSFWLHMRSALVLESDYFQESLSFLHFNSSALFNSNTTATSFEFVKRHMLHARTPHGSDNLRRQVHIAHGVLATTAVVLLFPSVAIILRVISSPNIIRLHWTLQLCNVGVLLVAFGLGCWLSYLDGWLWHWPHQIIGTTIVVMFLIQPIFGFVQHRRFRKTGVRSFYTTLHVWYGRGLILLGMINGGLGLQLANNTSMGIRGLYAVIVVCVVLAYVSAQVFWYYRIRKKVVDRAQTKEEQDEVGESRV